MPRIDFSEEENVEWDRRSGLKWFVHGELEEPEEVEDNCDTNYNFPVNNRKVSPSKTQIKRLNNDTSKPRQMLILKKSEIKKDPKHEEKHNTSSNPTWGKVEPKKELNNESERNSLAFDLWSLFKQELYCDIQILVGDKLIRAHKSILCARSTYFQAIFSGNFKEKDYDTFAVDESIPYHIFIHLLKWFYTDRMNVPLEHTLEVLIASDMYCETNAREYIESFILKNLAEVDAAILFAKSVTPSLKNAWNDFIKTSKSRVTMETEVEEHTLERDMIKLMEGATRTPFDCNITINGTKILAHKAILAARSDLFREAFASSDSVYIDDISLGEFKIVLHWMYTDEWVDVSSSAKAPIVEDQIENLDAVCLKLKIITNYRLLLEMAVYKLFEI